AKHFMGILEKPEVESIEGLSPIIAIEQKSTGSNPRSTVGTITEIYDFLRLLYARVATAYSPVTGEPMVRYTGEQIVSLILTEYNGRKCILLAPLVNGRKGHYRELFEGLRKKGYTQVRIDGEILDLSEVTALDRYKNHFIELVVDKLKPTDGDGERVRSSVLSALDQGKGSLMVLDMEEGGIRHFSRHLVDPVSGLSLAEPAPHSFSFNSPEGYCPHCKGLGIIANLDIDSIIPDRSLSIAQGAIVPLGTLRDGRKFEIIRAIARRYHFSVYDPVDSVPDEALSHIIYGSDELFRIGEGNLSEMVSFPGIVDDIEEKIVCPVCHGTRLNEQTQYFRIDGKTISEVSALEIGELAGWLDSLQGKLSERELRIGHDILKELTERVRFINEVGLEYLTLDRPAASLSGGEGQRIRLATQIGSKLVGVLYVLDEPSIGLHQKDNRKLISSLCKLRDEGNSIVVVEHDAETMLSSDWITDVGPGAGEAGGHICANAPLDVLLGKREPTEAEKPHVILGQSLTAEYLKGLRSIPVPRRRRRGNGLTLSVRGARGNNLKDISVDFPLGCFIGVSGVSGSGKSSLIEDTLVPALKKHFYRSKQSILPYREIVGMDNIDKLIEIDQSPIGRTSRSNPATFTGVFNDIRTLFEETADAKVRGFKAGRFSFNVAGGRCEECKGAGIKEIEMNFLPTVHVVCEKCRGRRYKEDTLAVKYKGKNINDILEMPVSEAYEFFKPVPKIAQKLKTMVDVGLGYVHLGQSAVTLSGGESQRMKLSAELQRRGTGNTLYIMDEPTTGLHFEDIKVLLSVIAQLVDQGNTVIIIEHNLDILKSVDYLIDLGPQGGSRGGQVVSCGTPEEVARDKHSVTGAYLKEVL
ncbi:MAG: excinuclease ABC subunit UvrA, partial [Bacteroidales bacterium]|nr:excinuclease ABC subunit UvrA [Bacteroidales bacterium]